MTLGFYLLENFLYHALFIDDEGSAQYAGIGHTIKFLLAINAISVRDLVTFVRKKSEWQLELLLELLV
jgi:hypothetical protein